MIYDFDRIISRKGTHSVKWEAGDLLKKHGLTDRFDQETIPLFVADMDFQCPQPVLDALHRRVDTMMFGYSNENTSTEYNDAIRGWFSRRHGWEIAPESIVYSPGTVEALNVAVRAYTNEGEGVIIQRPVYSPFTSAVKGNNRVLVNNSLINTDGYYTVDFDDLEAKAKDPNNKLFILCSPHNPVGRVWTQDELVRMAEICLANDVIIIADEIHGDLVRKGVTHHPIRTLVDDDRLVICTATNKTFNMAGLHCSNIIIENPELRATFAKTLGGKHPTPFAITALIAAYNEGEEWLAQVNDYIDGNLTFLQDFLAEQMPQVKFWMPEGTYIGWLDFSGYGLSPKEVHDRIYHRANVALQDGDHFGDEGLHFQRICVPSPRPILRQALERIADQF